MVFIITTYKSIKYDSVYKVCALEKVIDGDTVDICIHLGFDVITRQRIRLVGIDAPESRTSDMEEKEFGMLSKQQLKNWCIEASISEDDNIEFELRCHENKMKDKYGRTLGELWIKKDSVWININKWLCDNNFAVPYSGQDKEQIRVHHLYNRKIIQEKKRKIIHDVVKN